jgi:tetratricopeptide (TPR) repeat protein
MLTVLICSTLALPLSTILSAQEVLPSPTHSTESAGEEYVARKNLEAQPDSLSALRLMAESLEAHDHWQAAILYWKRLIALSDNGEYQTLLGNAQLHADNPSAAIGSLKTAVSLQPDSFNAWANLGVAQSRTQQFSEAVVSLQKALQFHPDDLPTQLTLVKALASAFRFDEALTLARECERRRPSNTDVLVLLEQILQLCGRPDEALATLRRVMNARPLNANEEADLGRLLLFEGLSAEAHTHLLRALSLDPYMPGIHAELARCAHRMNDQEGARREESLAASEAILATHKAEVTGLIANAALLEAAGDRSQALELYRRAVPLVGSDPRLTYATARGFVNAGHQSEAEQLLVSAENHGLASADMLALHSLLFEAQGKTHAAEVYLRRALKLDPSSVLALTNLGALLGKYGRVAEAESFLNLAIETDPEAQDALVDLALLMASENHLVQAQTLVERALHCPGDHSRANAALSAICSTEQTICAAQS